MTTPMTPETLAEIEARARMAVILAEPIIMTGEECLELLDEIRRLRALTEWRPIADCPKTGHPFDVWCLPPWGVAQRVTDCWWSEDHIRRHDDRDSGEFAIVHNATHFLPLPPPPSESDAT